MRDCCGMVILEVLHESEIREEVGGGRDGLSDMRFYDIYSENHISIGDDGFECNGKHQGYWIRSEGDVIRHGQSRPDAPYTG